MHNGLPPVLHNGPNEVTSLARPHTGRSLAPGGEGASPSAGAQVQRVISALQRHKWLILAVATVGTAAGAYATRFVQPEYTVRSTIWIETEGSKGQNPFAASELLKSSGWIELLRSYQVLDHVVRTERLYLKGESPSDSLALASFTLQDRFRPGEYRLKIDKQGRQYRLATVEGVRSEITVEQGAVGDSIARQLGFGWAPPRQALGADRTISFTVVTPRDAAMELSGQLRTTLPSEEGNFLRLELSGKDPERITSVMNTLTTRYIAVAKDLKRAKLEELAKLLDDQLAYAARSLQEEERAFEGFRVQTITLPTDRGTPIAPGLEVTQDPVFRNYFALKLEKEQIRRDREALARAMQSNDPELTVNALEGIPAVQSSSSLALALKQLTEKRAELRAMRNQYTDLYGPVQRLQTEVESMEQRTTPALVGGLASELAAREAAIDGLIGSASGQLRDVPPRAIEEARRKRRVEIAENLYKVLQQRYEEARLSAVTSIPDIRVLDEATVPFNPSKDPRVQLFLLALVGSLAVPVAGVILLDRLNPRLAYPEQITGGLGLNVLGAIPGVRRQNQIAAESAAHLVEAFRSLRLNLVHASGATGPLMLTVSSPGSGEGKTFVTANLALSFVEQGHRVLVIDGDLRRGTLHQILGCNRKPGLTDFLAGNVSQAEIIQPTAYPTLHVIGSGTRSQTGPELLGSAALPELVAELRSDYSVILIDSPPMGACVDPLVLATLTRDMLMVIRTDVTDRAMAESNLDTLDRLPIRVLGAVVNATLPNGAYRAYEYLPGYEILDAEETKQPRQLQGT